MLHDSSNPDWDARHLYGPGQVNQEPSMLQLITTTRLLDVEQVIQQSLDPESDTPTRAELEARAHDFRRHHGPVLNLQSVIQRQAAHETMALAAEFKRASPSKGLMASDQSVTAAAQTSLYAHAGADIISVLTEPTWFWGSWDDLTDARLATAAASQRRRPAILCKEFIVHEYMIAQAAAAGADTCLLIVAVLPQHVLQRLIDYARNVLDMEPLVEVHAMEELDVAIAAGAKVIGVNNRNLHTFQMDLSNSEKIAAELTRRHLDFATNYTLCALSGMSSAADVHRYRQAGLQMCLIGESLMRSPHPTQAIASLCLNAKDYAARHQSNANNNNNNDDAGASGAYTAGLQLIKVCGITRPEDATVACQAGANLIGVIFADKSKRQVTPDQAKAIVAAVRAFGERPDAYTFADAATTQSHSQPLPHLIAAARHVAEAAPTRRPLVVGVFQNQDSNFIAQMVQECGLDLVQLHGQEGFAAAHPTQCGGVPALRVVDVPTDPTAASLPSDTTDSTAAAVDHILSHLSTDPMAVLLDTSIRGAASGGGTSVTFDWTLAQAVQNAGLPVLVAGGLTPTNIADCVSAIRPFGIDVSSGVEDSPGIKNHDAIRKFVQAARHASDQANQGF